MEREVMAKLHTRILAPPRNTQIVVSCADEMRGPFHIGVEINFASVASNHEYRM
jgi:hypothetical protein